MTFKTIYMSLFNNKIHFYIASHYSIDQDFSEVFILVEI
jgi:hypothetical protein